VVELVERVLPVHFILGETRDFDVEIEEDIGSRVLSGDLGGQPVKFLNGNFLKLLGKGFDNF
jgi:hypothetical protein